MKTILRVIAVCVWISACNLYAEDPVVSIRATAPAGTLEPGKSTILNVRLEISKPYHINSNTPLQDFLIPTVLELEPVPGVTFGKTAFPPAPLKEFSFSDSPMSVYEGSVNIAVEMMLSANFSSKEITVKGKVRYQACDDRSCLPPVWEAFSMALPVTLSAGSRVDGLKEPPASAPSGTAGAESSGADFGGKSLLATILLVFLGGLALNLTPCVYPMIPITITYFGGQAQGKKGSLIAHSVVYVLGMAVTYSILGVVAAMSGGLFGAANQYPPVLIGIALVMVALALSLFDVYELRMPQFLNRLAGNSKKGFLGTLLMGLTVGIVAAPCIGPFVLGLLTYVGNKGSVLLGFALFFVLALGLGVPFLFLGAFSGSIQRLPRSGAWMVWVRKIFGFILLAMAVYFVKPLFPSGLAYYLTVAMIMLLAGIYMAWIDTVAGSGRIFAYVRNAVGICFFAVALYSAITGLEEGVGKARISSTAEAPGDAIQWHPYSESMLSVAMKEAKPIFIDFYADWCAPCKELDEKTYSAPEVVTRSRDFVMLKVDLTSADDPQAEMLRKKYQARGVPTLVFLTPDGREIPGLRGTGFESKEVFLEKMNRALKKMGD